MLGSGQTCDWEGHPQVPDLSSFSVTMENIEPQEKLLCLYNDFNFGKNRNDLSCIIIIHFTYFNEENFYLSVCMCVYIAYV